MSVSPSYAKFMAKCDAAFINSKVEHEPFYVFATSKIKALPFQLEDFTQLADMMSSSGEVRALLSYETGLGKTVVAGLLIRQLLIYKPNARVLIVVPPMIMRQWEEELSDKFSLSFHEYSVEEDLQHQLVIGSMDTLRSAKRLKAMVESGYSWDLVVVDELHRATPGNKRYAMLQWVSDHTTHFLGLTATPHDGKRDHFIGRLQLISPSVNEENYQDFLEGHNFRRLKKDVTDIDGKPLFPFGVTSKTLDVRVSAEEEDFYRAVEDYVRNEYNLAFKTKRRSYGLVASVIGRIVSSSVPAGLEALKKRVAKLSSGAPVESAPDLERKIREAFDEGQTEEGESVEQVLDEVFGLYAPEDREAVQREVGILRELIRKGEEVARKGKDSKLQDLKGIIEAHAKKGEKVIVFTQFVATANYIYDALNGEFKAHVVTGQLPPDERRANIHDFLRGGQVLIGTEVIGESLNLQQANVVVNYEIPWTPIPVIQRVGRVYRYGQDKRVYVYNFTSQLKVERRVLEVMYRKIDTLVTDFDEGSAQVIGEVISEHYVQDLLEKVYSGWAEEEAERDLEKKMGSAEKQVQELKEVLDLYEAPRRHVDASPLIRDPTKVVTDDDIRRFLLYAREAGLGDGDPYANPPTYHFKGLQMRALKAEDPCVKAVLKEAYSLEPTEVSLVGERDGEAVVYEIKYLDADENVRAVDVMVIGESWALPYEQIRDLKETKGDNWVHPSREGFPQPSVEMVSESLKDRIKELEDQLAEECQLKIEYLQMLKEMIDKTESPQAFKEAYKERKDEEIDKQRRLAREGLKVVLGDVLGYINFISKEQAYLNGDEDYDPAVLEAKSMIENAAMQFVMDHERKKGCQVEDVHQKNMGYDLISMCRGQEKLIEVKGLSATSSSSVIVTERERKASNFRPDAYYLYVVLGLPDHPHLKLVRPPFRVIGIHYQPEYEIEI
ncbi:MAG: helicase-related protein [Thermoprotei archaeon]